MPDILHFIFRAGELFLPEGRGLPREIPAELAPSVVDSLDFCAGGKTARAVLLAESAADPSPDAAITASASRSGWLRLRTLIASREPELAALAPTVARALGLANWHAANRFCGRCGKPLSDHPSETALVCRSCGQAVYPRLSPAIIVLVEREGRILLARHARRNQDVWSCIAGFLEHGETLEDCVAREVREETALEIRNIRYAGSQSWPFPDQFMVAFRADWKAGEIRVDPAEIQEARWFDRSDLPPTPKEGSVAWRLIHDEIGAEPKNLF